MDHNNILKWIVDDSITLPSSPVFDENELIELIEAHKIPGRFIHRLAGQDVFCFTRHFKGEIAKLHLQTKELCRQNIEAIHVIKSALPRDVDIIIIKGISTYVLVGHERVMRLGDIDILSNSPRALVDTLIRLGYVQTRPPFMHEIGEYTKGVVEVDIHGNFPVCSFDQSLLEADLVPSANPGVWQQNHRSRQNPISFNDLMLNSHKGNTSDVMGITVADPNVLAIIICAHGFMNYINMWSISHREKAYVSLGEVADLFELVRHPKFNIDTFQSIAKNNEATDAIAWASSVTSVLFGKALFAANGDGDRERHRNEMPQGRFPRCLWWGFWADLPAHAEDLTRKWWLSMDWLTTELGHNKLSLDRCYSTVKRVDGVILTRCLVQNDCVLPLTIKVSLSDGKLVIKAEVLSDIEADIDRIRIDFGHISSEWMIANDRREQRLIGNEADVRFDSEGQAYTVEFSYPLELFNESVKKSRKVSMFIGVGKQSQNSEALLDSILIPMVVSIEGCRCKEL